MGKTTVTRLILCLSAVLLHMNRVNGTELSIAQTNYMLQCQGCHQVSGSGQPPQTPDFHEHGSMFMHSPEGRKYWISVPGAANAPLSDGELADVLNYIAQDLVKVKNHQAFTASEVNQYRGKKMQNVYEFRRNLINQLSSAEHP